MDVKALYPIMSWAETVADVKDMIMKGKMEIGANVVRGIIPSSSFLPSSFFMHLLFFQKGFAYEGEIRGVI